MEGIETPDGGGFRQSIKTAARRNEKILRAAYFS